MLRPPVLEAVFVAGCVFVGMTAPVLKWDKLAAVSQRGMTFGYEFILRRGAQVTRGDQIPVPADVAQQLPAGSTVRVTLLWETGEDEDWRRLSLERFAGAYAPEYSVYEKLADDAPSQ
jgi:hypothetical protein